MMDTDKLAVSPQQAFDMIGLSKSKGYELLAAGEFQAFKEGRSTRITTESVRAYVARRVAENPFVSTAK